MDSPRDPGGAHFINFGAILTAAACAVAVFFVLGVFAFVRPASEPSSALTTYSQSVRFGYSAHVAPGPVYPTGAVSTGDPIFLTLVHRLGIHVDYGLTSQASSGLSGTEKVVLTLAAPNGWSRSFVLTPSTHFTGGHTSTDVTLDLTDLQSLLVRIGRLTDTGFASFSIHVVPRIDISGIVGGHPVKTRFDSGLTFALANGELQPSAGAGSSTANLSVSKSANVSSPRIAPASITVLGVSAEISLLRWIAILGLLVSGAAAVFFYLRKRAEPFQETAHIQSHFGHMIVPIVAGEDLGWPAVDVPTIKALVRLAESGQRLILHSRANDVDTYMVNDEGTVYRYQVKPSKVVWGEWSTPAADLEEAASEIARVAADAAPSASSAA